jgi:hypothetical protein
VASHGESRRLLTWIDLDARSAVAPLRAAPAMFRVLLGLVLALVTGCGSTSTTSVGPSPVKCEVSLGSPTPLGVTGGTGTIVVSTQRECAWTATTDASWITRLTPQSGQGSGQIEFDASVNPVPSERQAEIVVNDSRVQVRQDFSPCAFDVSPVAITVPAPGGSRSINITTVDGCTWSTTTTTPWLSVPSGGPSNGTGSVTVQAAANGGGARAGSLTVAGRAIAISQSAGSATGCDYSIQPNSLPLPASGANSTATVTSPTGCAWSATTDVPWITIVSGAAGSGTGPVTFAVSTNSTASARTGRVTVEGQSLTVNQSAGSVNCQYSIDPSTRSVGAGGGSVATSVSVSNGCVWTAVSNASWLTIVSGATGNGNGGVNIEVAPNGGPARSGTATVAGRVLTVNQAGGCSFTVDPDQLTIGSEGGASSTSVSTGAGCGWTASVSAQSPWITITSGASGSGPGTVSFTVAANPGPPRNGSMTVAGHTFAVNQVTGCAYSISPASQTVGPGGGSGSTTVTASSGCAWTASSNASFITVPPASASGTGNGTVNFTIAPNSGPQRSGTLTVAGRTFTVTQTSGCSYALTANSQSFGPGGGSGTTTVVTNDGCTWTAVVSSQAPWITVTSGASGSGDGTVSFNVASNTGAQRSGTIAIAGHTFTVTQSVGCSYSIAPTSQAAGAGQGSGSTTITAPPGCAWTATSNASFLTITSGASGNGNGTTNFTIAANTGPQRTGTLTVAGQTFTVNQASGCTYAISPTSDTEDSGSGKGNISITAPGGCSWTATSNAAFLTITSGASGSGNGTTTYTIAANTGPQRTGTLTVAGQTFTLTQLSGCVYTIAPTSQSIPLAGGNGTVTVTAGAGCTWTAVSNVPWVTITNGASGNGNGTVSYSVASTGSKRSGSMTIAGRTFMVNQP